MRRVTCLCVLISSAAGAGCAAARRGPAIAPGPSGAEPFIAVLGQVNRPDRVPSTAPRPLCELVAIAGGPTALACRRVIVDRVVSGRRFRWAVTVDALGDSEGCRLMIWPGDAVVVGDCGE
ncbi:MAG: hypothetical protein U0269_35180 [Polyangiales bacterium]